MSEQTVVSNQSFISNFVSNQTFMSNLYNNTFASVQ